MCSKLESNMSESVLGDESMVQVSDIVCSIVDLVISIVVVLDLNMNIEYCKVTLAQPEYLQIAIICRLKQS